MNRNTYLCLALAAMLSFTASTQAQIAEATTGSQDGELQQQLDVQGSMLLDKLRQARKAGLSGDPWGMRYALQEAQRLLGTMSLAENLSKSQLPVVQHPKKSGSRGEMRKVALTERLEIDSPLPSGHMQPLDELEEPVGAIQLSELGDAVGQALQELGKQPPSTGAALIAVQQALGKIHWQNGLEPQAWVKARDLLIRGYGHLLDNDPQAMSELRRSGELLADLPYGRSYAQRLYQVLQSSPPDLAGMRVLLQALDNKILVSRMSAERSHLEGRNTTR